LDMYPNDIDALKEKSFCLVRAKRFKEAVPISDKILLMAPESSDAWHLRGIMSVNMKQGEMALKYIDKSLAIETEFDALVNAGNCWELMGKWKEAAETFDKAIALNPNDAEAWHNKGSMLEDMGQMKEALKCYNKSISCDSKYADAWFGKANVFLAQEKYNKAVKYFNKALYLFAEHKPIPIIEFKDIALAEAWTGKANALEELGKKKEAIDALNRALPFAQKAGLIEMEEEIQDALGALKDE